MKPEGKRLWKEQSGSGHLMVEESGSWPGLSLGQSRMAEPALTRRVLPAHQDHPKLAAGTEGKEPGRERWA